MHVQPMWFHHKKMVSRTTKAMWILDWINCVRYEREEYKYFTCICACVNIPVVKDQNSSEIYFKFMLFDSKCVPVCLLSQATLSTPVIKAQNRKESLFDCPFVRAIKSLSAARSAHGISRGALLLRQSCTLSSPTQHWRSESCDTRSASRASQSQNFVMRHKGITCPSWFMEPGGELNRQIYSVTHGQINRAWLTNKRRSFWSTQRYIFYKRADAHIYNVI